MKRAGLFLALVLTAALLAGCGTAPQIPKAVYQYTEPGADPQAWVLVPAGEFPFGQFNHPTNIDYDYEIMVTEVTNAQYADYLNQALAAGTIKIESGNVMGYYLGEPFQGYKHEVEFGEGYYIHMPLENPATRISFDGKVFSAKPGWENHPVTMVSWFGAKAYADFFGYRLPTESEWEKAARGTEPLPFPWGYEIEHGNANWYHSHDPFEGSDGYSHTTPVGFYNGQTYGDFKTIDSPSPYGAYDMAGNVEEWCADDYENTHNRYIRGGNKDSYEVDLRVWKRNSSRPDYVSPRVGFRCVRDPQSKEVIAGSTGMDQPGKPDSETSSETSAQTTE